MRCSAARRIDRWRSAVTAVVALVLPVLQATSVFSAAITAGNGSSAQAERRTIYRSADRPILPQLRDTDVELEVLAGDDPPLRVILPNMVEFLTRGSDVVAVLQISQVQGRLTPDGTWVETHVRADIVNLLRTTRAALRSGDSIDFALPGGTLNVGGRRILANSSWAKPLEQNGIYLVFARLRNEQVLVSPHRSTKFRRGSRYRTP
jgi:hypothetical protein